MEDQLNFVRKNVMNILLIKKKDLHYNTCIYVFDNYSGITNLISLNRILNHIPRKYHTRQLIMKAIAINPSCFIYLEDKFLTNEIAVNAIRFNINNYYRLPKKLRHSNTIIYEVLLIDPYQFYDMYLPNIDTDVIHRLAHLRPLEVAKIFRPRLRHTREVCLERSPKTCMYLDDLKDSEIRFGILSQPDTIKYLRKPSFEAQMMSVLMNPNNIIYIKKPAPEIVCAAFRNSIKMKQDLQDFLIKYIGFRPELDEISSGDFL